MIRGSGIPPAKFRLPSEGSFFVRVDNAGAGVVECYIVRLETYRGQR
jgi:hypothetical protein